MSNLLSLIISANSGLGRILCSLKKAWKLVQLHSELWLINILKEGRVWVTPKAYFGGILCKNTWNLIFRHRTIKNTGKKVESPNLVQIHLTLPKLRLLSSKGQGANIFESHLNPVILYSLDCPCWALTDEYLFTRVSIIFQNFLHNFVLTRLASSNIRVRSCLLKLM